MRGKKITRDDMKKQSIKKLERQLKQERFDHIFNAVMFWIMSFLFWISFYYFAITPLYLEGKFYDYKIIFDGNFSELDQQYFYDIIDDVKPEYFIDTKDITVVKINKDNDWSGRNTNGHIIVELYKNREKMKEIICHELSHNFVNRNEHFHSLVYDLGREGVCYE